MMKFQTAGWAKYSHEQYGLESWGASGPYKKVYEKFGITGDSTFPFHAWSRARASPLHRHRSRRKEGSGLLCCKGWRGCISSG